MRTRIASHEVGEKTASDVGLLIALTSIIQFTRVTTVKQIVRRSAAGVCNRDSLLLSREARITLGRERRGAYGV